MRTRKEDLLKRLELKFPDEPYMSYERFWEIKSDCEFCNGFKRVYLDEPDPIEGHKLSRVAKCEACHGTGKCSQEEAKERWKKYRKELKRKQKKYMRKAQIVQLGLDKLTLTEIEAIYDLAVGNFGNL